ncbi:MAG: hypothetical protein ACC645_26940 [Pirellulales bacterium]
MAQRIAKGILTPDRPSGKNGRSQATIDANRDFRIRAVRLLQERLDEALRDNLHGKLILEANAKDGHLGGLKLTTIEHVV